MNVLWIRKYGLSVNGFEFVKLDIDSINSFSVNEFSLSETTPGVNMLVINGEDFCEDRNNSLYNAIMKYFTNPDRRGAKYPLQDAVRKHNDYLPKGA
tara:strand:+ start:29 stop:319 length:291 start_codon:yes stop_codon:yes gene_type:complete